MRVFVLILSFAIASQAYPKGITRSGREENDEWRKREKHRENGNGENEEEDRDELQRGFYEVDYALQVPHLNFIKYKKCEPKLGGMSRKQNSHLSHVTI